MSQPTHNLTHAKILAALELREAGVKIRDIALEIDEDVHVLREFFKGKKRELPGPRKRCPGCGYMITVEPCLQCEMERNAQLRRQAIRNAARKTTGH
jgi:hypothetical protein